MDRYCPAGSKPNPVRYLTRTLCPGSRKKDIKKISALNRAVIFILHGIRPLLGPATCRYPLSCGKYAIKQLREKPLAIALWRITKRLLTCNPLIGPRK